MVITTITNYHKIDSKYFILNLFYESNKIDISYKYLN